MVFAPLTVLLTAEPSLPERKVPTRNAGLTGVIEVLTAHTAELKECALKAPQTTRVRVTLIWTISADGTASAVGVDQPEFSSHPAALCVATRLRAWRFASSNEPRVVSLAFAFGGRAEDGDYFETDCHFRDSAR